MENEFYTAGTVVNAHGTRGEVKIHTGSLSPELLIGLKAVFLDGQEIAVRSARVHKEMLLMTLSGVEDMDAALALKGRTVTFRRSGLKLPAGVYLDEELIGLTVLDDATGEELGKVTDVLLYPAHKVYEVQGAREYLIPAVPEVFIGKIDLGAGTMRVHMMKGLATDEN